jgi:drug/metabolite transporter (DMT)-like permease
MRNRSAGGSGISLAALSAATFGTSGAFGSSLIDAGWSPAAAVTARIVIAALVLTVPGLIVMRGRWHQLRQGAPMVAVYGLVAVAGVQLCYFNAVAHLSVGVALLLEYLGIVLVVGWLWLRHGQRPRRLTVIGAAIAIGGLLLVLDLTGAQHLSPVGVLWGFGGAVGLAVYYLISAAADEPLPPLAVAWGGMCVGAVALVACGALGILPMRAPRTDVVLLDRHMSWLIPVLGLSLIAAVIAYVAGIGAARLLGARLASFVGLTEVVFGVGFAWLLLNQVPTALQLLGGGFILGGVTLVRIDELRSPIASSLELPAEGMPRAESLAG